MSLVRLKDNIEHLADDGQLQRTDPAIVGELYWLLERFSAVAGKKRITFWAHFGSLLGAIRHGGIIPWDQDIDLQYFESDTEKLARSQSCFKKNGISLSTWWGGYKLFRTERIKTTIHTYPPAIDLYPSKKSFRGNIVFSRWRARLRWYSSIFHLSDLFPLASAPFGPITIPIPSQYEAYLEKVYGKDWNTTAYKDYDNLLEQRVKPTKLRLVDRGPADYILPET